MKEKLYSCEFDKTPDFNDQQPEGFKEWVKYIKHRECLFILPDKSSYDMKPFVDNQGFFNKYSYTNFILRRYEER